MAEGKISLCYNAGKRPLKAAFSSLLASFLCMCYYSTMLKIGSKMWDLQLNKKQCNYNLVLILFSLGLDQLKNYSKIKDVQCAMIWQTLSISSKNVGRDLRHLS